MRFGILATHSTSTKAIRFLRALYEAAEPLGIEARYFDQYQPCDVLILYGLGGPDRLPIAESHRAQGKLFFAFDLGYWGREDKDRVFRLSINSNHPSNVMAGPRPDSRRFDAAGLSITNVFDPDGPVMLIGNSTKSRVFGTDGWAAERSKEIRSVFGERQLIYRPKPKHPIEPKTRYDLLSSGPVEEALIGVSLVVCRHSNVAIDACLMGVPVVCEGGAGAEIYPNRLEDYRKQPSAETRLEFLHRLAWWQYRSSEADLAWQAIRGKV